MAQKGSLMQKKVDCILHFCINSNFPQQIREKRNIRKKYKIMFCSSCGSLIIPNNGKYVCNVCGNEEKLKGENRITAKSTGKEMVFIKESSRVEPLDSEAVCPKCNHKGAYYVLKQTRAADEPETAIYTCQDCGHRWREY